MLPIIYYRNTKTRDIPFNRRNNGKRTVRGQYANGSKTGGAGSGSGQSRDGRSLDNTSYMTACRFQFVSPSTSYARTSSE